MKNITLSADEDLIEMARAEARKRKTSLNALFREWLGEIANRDAVQKRADEVIRNLSKHLAFEQKFTRDELNER